MASWERVIRCAAIGFGAVVVVAGCSSGNGGSGGDASTLATPTIAPDVPAGFDACKDIPQSVIQSEQLFYPHVDTQDGDGGIKWSGCRWLQSNDGYGATIDTTNITLAMVRTNRDFTVVDQMTVSGRAALTSRVSGQDPRADCTINIEIKGGSLEISVDNPASRKTGTQDSCEIAKRLAQGIAPAIPATL